MMIVDSDLLSMQEARILAEDAARAQRMLAAFPQEKLDEIVEAVAEAVGQQTESLAVRSHEETDYGIPTDKQIKNNFVCCQVRKALRGIRCVGVIERDAERQTMDIGVPMGVIAALCPATSPVSTTIYKTLIAIKSGNAIVFSPHPRAAKSIAAALDIMIKAAHACGLPEGCLSYMGTVTRSGTAELMNHACTSLIMLSGVPGMIDAARCSGKPVIYGGIGHGPAFIERSADVHQAVSHIVSSKTFDNGIAPSAEQSIVVDACIDRDVRHALQDAGAYFMSDVESLRLAEVLFCADGRCKTGMAGVSATVLAHRAGFGVPAHVKLLIAERKYVSEADPYSRELLAPVLAYYVEDDWMHACEKCIELLLHERKAHTLVVHSRDEDVILQFALKKPVGRLLVNTPAAFGGLGMSTNLFPSMTLGSGSAGQGITADNVSSMNLIYRRKIGYGVRPYGSAAAVCSAVLQGGRQEGRYAHDTQSQQMQALQKILTEVIEAMGRDADR